MKYAYIYDISNGKIMAFTDATANYAKIQERLKVTTDVALGDRELKGDQIFKWQINLESKTLERKPVSL